ncbi:MAG: sodium ion-translocating decarboxylase subunit beta [Clostridiales bacterium]|nr:sodium ion-translocating decarboxylase subunit beta [Clostridiales bacterium]
MLDNLLSLWESTGIAKFFDYDPWYFGKTLVMYAIVGVLVYLAVKKGFEPLLLLPIATGILLANLPGANLFHMDWFVDGVKLADGTKLTELSDIILHVFDEGGLLDILYLGVKLGIYPSLIFLGVGAMTDFSPLISNPKSVFLGGAAQFGVFAAFFGALLLGFNELEAAAIGIVGGADGPTAILITKILAPTLLGAIAIAAYSYMALIPMIQPPLMKLLTTKKERSIKMTQLRPVSKLEKIIFPIMVVIVVCLLLPDAAPLIGFLMFGNLLNVSGVTDRLSKTAQNGLINVITIFLGLSVGATASAENFLKWETLLIIILGFCAFMLSTVGGIIGGKIMCKLSGGKINPLIGSAGVSAVPMAARVSQKVGQEEDPSNFLLMHAMGPNVAGVIGSAICAGVFLALFR